MNHNEDTPIEPIYTSTSEFGVMYENQFVVLDDGKHVIGVDASDGGKLIFENIETGKADKFGWRDFGVNFITNMFYAQDTESFYIGDLYDDLYKYKLDKTNKSCKKVKAYGNIGIGRIISSHRFMNFVFFGGSNNKIKVLDLSRDKLLPGHLEAAIGCIYSLKVCVKSQDEIYLTVSGQYPNYSDDKTDLFEVTDLLKVDPVILQKYL